MRPTVLSAADLRSRVTPIPTPPLVRVVGSLGVGLSLAAMLSGLAPAIKAALVVGGVLTTIALTLAHPYRRSLRHFAHEKNVVRVPSLSMLVPLMMWWLLLMLAPLVAPLSAWGVAFSFALSSALAALLYPHVDGTRRLAYA